MKYSIYKTPTGLYAMEYYDTYDPDIFLNGMVSLHMIT